MTITERSSELRQVPGRREGPVRWGDGVPMTPEDCAAVVPPGDYGSQARYERERDRILRRSWFPGCHSTEIPNPGDYKVWAEFGDLAVIVRQADGGVAAFHNVCQHRGSRIVAESGCGARTFTCPWHGFVYGLDGTVVGVRDRESFAPGMLDGLTAAKISTQEWGGFVWMNLSGDSAPESLQDSLAELAIELGPYQLDRMVVHSAETWTMPCNWKTALSGFLENYHVNNVHPTTARSGTLGTEQLTSYVLFEKNSMFVIPYMATLDELRATQDHQRLAVCHYHLFPNTIVNCRPSSVQVFSFIPDGPRSTRYVCWNLIRPGDEGSAQDSAWAYFRQIVEEDVTVDVEAGATAESMAFVRLAGLANIRECRVAHFFRTANALVGSHG